MSRRRGQYTFPQEGASLKAEVEKSMADSSSRSFRLDDVHSKQVIGYEMSSEFVVVSQQEFLNFFGTTHKSKDPKLPQCRLVNAQGRSEVCYLFKDDSSYRKLRLISTVFEERASEIQTKQDHVHSRQGQESLQHATVTRLESTGLSDLFQKNACVCTMDEYYERLHRRKAGTAAAATSSKAAPSADVAGELAEEDEGEEGAVMEQEGEPLCRPVLVEAVVKDALFGTPADKAPKRAFSSVSSKADASSSKMQRSASSGAISVGAAGIDADLESEMGSKDDSKAKAEQSGKTTETPEQTCQRWISKLGLQSILDGKKLGVSHRHATTACSKMPTKPRLALSMHLQLASHAANLASDQVGLMEKDQIVSAIMALQGQDLRFPLALQKRLWSSSVQEQMSAACSSLQNAKFDVYWAHIRPYAEKPVPLNLLDPHLSSLSLDLAQRLQQFQDQLVTACLIESIMKGESSGPVLAFLCKAVLRCAEADLTMQIDDDAAEILFQLQTCVNAVLAIVDESWSGYQQHSAALQLLKKPPTEDSMMALFSRAVSQTVWYAEKQHEAMRALRSLEMHSKHLHELEAFLQQERTYEESYVRKMSELLRYLPALAEELPGEILDEIVQGFQHEVLKVWKWYQESAGGSCSRDALQQLIAEACISFSKQPEIQEMRNQLAELLQSAEGTLKSEKMLKAVAKLQAEMNESPSKDLSEILATTWPVCGDAMGCKVSAEGAAMLHGAFEEFLEKAKTSVSSMQQVPFSTLMDILNAMHSWLSLDDVEKAKVRKIANLGKLKMHGETFKKLVADMASRVVKEKGEEMLIEMMSDLEKLQLNSNETDWAEKETEDGVQIAEQMMQDAKTIMFELASTKLQQTEQMTAAVAGGLPDGASWDAGLAQGASFQAVMAKARSTVLAQDKTWLLQMYASRDKLQEVSVLHDESKSPPIETPKHQKKKKKKRKKKRRVNLGRRRGKRECTDPRPSSSMSVACSSGVWRRSQTSWLLQKPHSCERLPQRHLECCCQCSTQKRRCRD